MANQKTGWTELTRVQMPALVHLTRIGYTYFGKITKEDANIVYNPETNILLEVFKKQFAKLNPTRSDEATAILKQIQQELDYDDLGESFYNRLLSQSPVKLIDFEHPKNNVFHCTGEFSCVNGEDEFIPDITLFVNGLPLAFVEVKKPNNTGGMVAEAKRMNEKRFPNKKFRRFINITQLMIFSNNMEYDSIGGIVPIQGVFYCTGAKKAASFNCFREHNPLNSDVAPYNKYYPYSEIKPNVEMKILSDFNQSVIHTSPEYQTNLGINTPTNRVLTSMCSPERLLFILKYGFVYYHMNGENLDGSIQNINQKHIMRYQQLFASLEIKKKISEGVKSGIVWHTQGSGKTALSYHLTHVLSDYFSGINKVAKYYFIVDRLDLLKQARREFEARGLVVHTADSRAELMAEFKSNQSQEGTTGKPEITVVNIQRFDEDHEKVIIPAYATNLQRIFIIDEAHRGYKAEGSFLLNLFNADQNSIKIALTGTPLLKNERESWRVFGNYIHTYYYDKSIQDGYTLKIIREEIETSYKEKLEQIYESLEILVQKKDVKKSDIIEHENYVKELLRYIITDLKQFRTIRGDDTLGGMVICETSEQARKVSALFDGIQNDLNLTASTPTHFKAGLVLYDSGDKETKDQIITDFKYNNKIDLLIVYNMLLTGFDAPRLKRLYFGRKLMDHSLLQAITRVNRPYKDNKYGYVIDFADIKKNFEETNAAYLAELNKFNDPEEVGKGNEVDIFGQVLENPAELIQRLKKARQVLFNYTLDNAEIFSSEISNLEDKNDLHILKKALIDVRDCCNIAKTFGDDELKELISHLEVSQVKGMISEIERHISLINQKELFANNDSRFACINDAMQYITFSFKKKGQEELKVVSDASELQEKWRNVIRKFTDNIDQDDPKYITLREAFYQRFHERGFVLNDMNDYADQMHYLDVILQELTNLQIRNNALLKRYNGDEKFVRVHKRIREENQNRKHDGKPPIISEYEEDIVNVLLSIKQKIDQKVYDRNDILKKDAYFEMTVMSELTSAFVGLEINNESSEDRKYIESRISKQYLDQYNGTYSSSIA